MKQLHQKNLQDVVKPKTKSGKRFLEGRAPKLIENDKKAIFIRGINANNIVVQAMKDFQALKRPNAIFFNKKNDIKPFEDASSLEFFCLKSDACHYMFGSHNKKRPNNLVVGRMFDHRVLDMFEFGVEDFKSLNDFKTQKIASGCKPMLLFNEGFDQTPELSRIRNLFIDFFRGPVVEFINLKGMEHLLVFSIVNNKIVFRSYKVSMKKTDTNTPGVGLEEIGPHMTLSVRRSILAADGLFKDACRQPKQLKHTKVKNKSKDTFGTSLGRIHMERQDYGKLNTRKVKGLKKRKLVMSDQTENTQNKETQGSPPDQKKIKL